MLLEETSSRRKKLETCLRRFYSKATTSTRDQLLALVNFLPTLTISDLVRCAIDDETLHTLIPRLSVDARKVFKKSVLQFMELCVLEDKLERLVWKSSHRDELSDSQILDELVNTRQWDSAEYPYWLAFEVEGRLQIRDEQLVVAQHLINRPGTVCQLNMGRGKTRVILPMLFLHFAHSRDRRVVRVHFLGSLLSEACQYMHRYLSASTSQLCIFELPFHRRIGLDIRKLELIHDVLRELKAFGGIQVVAPEHRMSLELKRFELDKDDEVSTKILDEILDNGQYIDVLDECDAVLHHKYHLVYAAGHPIALSNGVERTEPLRKELKKALALDLIDNSELMWLNMLGKGVARDSLITAITDSTVSLQTALGEHMQKLLSYINQLLALRGLIAFGVLEHCQEKRYRVDFGLPLPDTRPKKIAIPFRAADVPSEQSEFSHPDVCIALTLLGYYHRGLSDKEVQLTFEKLLRLDISEQVHQYDRWYASAKPDSKNTEIRKTLCDVRHISLTDARQFKTLCNVFRFCMETINFFLNTDVFPKDTQQYPQRLSRTAWNIAAGGNNIGFSGTNDNHRLLPLSVTQLEPVYPLLLGTNGDMLHKIMQESHGYEVVGPSLDSSPVPWQSVLLYALGKGVQALIDTGALLAGVMNHEAAEFLLERSDFAFAGVTYFDNRNKTNCWMVAEKDRRLVLPLKESSMLEKDTFVIFDEARSRGSDMKLPPNASAVLTLGPRLTKDKLMQGAGRMRQLGRNQTLWIASFDEVAQSILQAKTTHCGASDLTAVDVLKWVVDNTKAESVNGLLEWAGNGFHYRKTQHDQKEEWVPEDWSLEMLYQGKLHAETITHIIESKARSNFEGIDDDVVSRIRNSGRTYGLEDEVCVTAHTDESERELEVEVEEKVQEQQILEVAHCSPAQEKTWNYAEILRVQSIEELDGVVRVYALESFIRQWIYPKTFADLAWSTTHIFGTENFFSTVLQARNEDQMNEYLRFIDVVLVFDNGQVLLVSECEADHILQLLWSSASCSFRFVNLAFAWDSIDRAGKHPKFQDIDLALGSRLDRTLPLLPATSCHLYNGETMLSKDQQMAVEPIYRELLRPLAQRETTTSNFVKSRGNIHKWTRSFLHELCCRMDLEDCTNDTIECKMQI
ncbi:hypothetical protein PI124_g827 [Phytophthora idaei]|nr:hypothetical protein PI124_g827 [Phytophthora idaei]